MATGAELLERHLPILRYDSQGSFMADAAAVMTDRATNVLRRADGSVIASGPALGLPFLGWPRYADGTAAGRADHLDAVGRDYVRQAREMHRPPYADRIYGRAAGAGGGRWWLQYWLFYLYNDKAFLGFGLHEGDWEMVQVRIAAGGKPVSMAFAQHSHGQRCDWQHVERRGERPVVYVARGSQASFPSPGRHDAPIVPDYADGKGPEVANAALEPIGESGGWWAWPGRWGSTRARNKFESDSPRGPRHQEKWREPATFHEECDEIAPGRRAPGGVPGPPAPAIAVRREEGRAVVAYRFTAAPGRPRPVFLLVTLDSLPPATVTHAVEGERGELQHPLPLEDRPYTVTATAVDERGNAGEPAVVPLA